VVNQLSKNISYIIIIIIVKSFEAFTAAMFQVEVLWVVTPCNIVIGYQRFEEYAISIFRL